MNSSNTDAPGSESSDLNGARVLVVEDTWYLGMALKNQLRSLGAEVVGPCATTAEAERLISEQPADVALVDYNLRGGERADRLIDLLHDRGIRVIVTSGFAALAFSPAKVVKVLQKPIVETELIAALRLSLKSLP